MKKLSAKNLVDFRRRTNRGKYSFVDNLKANKIDVPVDGGGDYWIPSLSAVCAAYKVGDLDAVEEKIKQLQEKIQGTKHSNTKAMYSRNIDILQGYKNMSLKKLRPNGELSFLKKSTSNALQTIEGLEIETRPSHIYTFGKKDDENIGAIWFTVKVNGYRREEVGMFCDLLYRFLKQNYSMYRLLPRNCVAVDLLSGHIVDYSAFTSDGLTQLLVPTLKEIKLLL